MTSCFAHSFIHTLHPDSCAQTQAWGPPAGRHEGTVPGNKFFWVTLDKLLPLPATVSRCAKQSWDDTALPVSGCKGFSRDIVTAAGNSLQTGTALSPGWVATYWFIHSLVNSLGKWLLTSWPQKAEAFKKCQAHMFQVSWFTSVVLNPGYARNYLSLSLQNKVLGTY